MRHKRKCVLGVVCLLTLAVVMLRTAGGETTQRIRVPGNLSDPGPRTGTTDAGGPIAGLSAHENEYFLAGQEGFNEIDDVQGTVTGHKGLGPTFNLDGCATCHAHPAVGGSSPPQNPQIARKNTAGAFNPTDFLDGAVTATGPVREMRRVSQGGGVQGLFTIKGRSDAPGCNLNPPDLRQISGQDRRFRIPTPVFGLGLIEAIPDSTIAANEAANKPFGISGKANRSGNDGTITRFGWKAQNKSLVIFTGEAYNVEQGVSNEVFPNERMPAGSNGCAFNATPEDHSNFDETDPVHMNSDAVAFANFMRFLAPPKPATSGFTTALGVQVSAASITNGKGAFNSAGCSQCHIPTMTTGKSMSAALDTKPVNLFSDLLVHDIGTGDQITQGAANGNEFRTTPLWGVGQRLFFLHDGRSNDLVEAIEKHDNEANGVMFRYHNLSNTDRQDLINFLRSL